MALMKKEKRGTISPMEPTIVPRQTDKVLDVDAAMQGTITFRDPVNLRINGTFEGNLDIRGKLTIGEKAVVNADINGDSIVIAGRVKGKINAKKDLKLANYAHVVGDVKTPSLEVERGAILQGHCRMGEEKGAQEKAEPTMSPEEVARYLEVETSLVLEWANSGKIPAQRTGDSWKFNRSTVDEWVASEKLK